MEGQNLRRFLKKSARVVILGYSSLRVFDLPPRSPKLNWYVEQAHRTHTEEFYEVTESSFDTAELKAQLLEWERTYKTIKPHQSLSYLTPLKFLEKWKENQRKKVVCH
jgi:putative transposase